MSATEAGAISHGAVARRGHDREEEQLRDLFHKILTDRVVFRGGAAQEQLAHFIGKVPSMLLSMPHCIVARPALGEDEVSGKRAFSVWVLRRFLLLWNRKEFTALSTACFDAQEAILRLLLLRQPAAFAELIGRYVDTLTELNSRSDSFYDNIAPTSAVTIKLMGEDRLPQVSEDAKEIVFEDPDQLEGFQCKIVRLLTRFAAGICDFLPHRVPDLCALSIRNIEVGEMHLKAASLSCTTAIWKEGGFPKSAKLALFYYDALFSLVVYMCSEESGDVDEQSKAVIERELEQSLQASSVCRGDLLTKRLFVGRAAQFWKRLLQSADTSKRFLDLSDDLRHILCQIASVLLQEPALGKDWLQHLTDVVCVNWTRDLGDIISSIVALELKSAQETSIGARMPKKSEALIKLHERSATWRAICQNLNSKLAEDDVSVSESAKMGALVSATAAKLDDVCGGETKLHVEFLERELLCCLVQHLIQRVLSKPGDASALSAAAATICDILRHQSVDTLTQGLLQQCVGLVTLPWMDGEVKLSDLRLGETLANNMIRVSERIAPASLKEDFLQSAFCTLALLNKKVLPKWRMHVTRKAWSRGEPRVQSAILAVLPLFVHQFGPLCTPLVQEIVREAVAKSGKEVVLCLAKTAGGIVCALAKQTVLAHRGKPATLLCNVCHNNNKGKYQGANLALGDVEELLKLLGHSDFDVRLAILELLKPMSNHVGFQESTASLWMNYGEESDIHIRNRFTSLIGYLSAPAMCVEGDRSLTSHAHFPGWSDQEAVCGAIVANLEDVAKKVQVVNDELLTDSVCRMLVNVGSTGVRFLTHVVAVVVDLLVTQATHVSAFCRAEDFLVEQLATNKIVVLQRLTEKLCEEGSKGVLELFIVATRSPNIRVFLKQHIHHILPYMVLLCAMAAKKPSFSPIEDLAAQLHQKSRHLIAENIPFIYPYIVVQTSSTQEYNKCTVFLESETKIKLTHLLPSNRQKVITELLASFHVNSKRILSALHWLAASDDDFKARGKGVKLSDEEVASYIIPKLLGVLGYFDQRLTSPSVSLTTKMEVVRSLKCIIEWLGSKHLSTVKHRILSTMKTAASANLPDAEEVIVETWDAFVRTIDLASLGPLLGLVLASLLPFIARGVARVEDIFRYLILENRSSLAEHFAGLNFLPKHPLLAEINQAIRSELKIDKEPEFKVVLQYTVNSMENESAEVKILTLEKLKELLKDNQGKLQGLILSSDQVDPFVTKLIRLLLSSTRDSDPTVVHLAGQCLGFIGAVDPGRLDKASSLTEGFDISLTVHEEDFILELLRTLVKAYLSTSDSMDAEACAYSIQEVLKAYGIGGPASMATLGGRIWNQCSDSMREVLTPLLSSLYSRTDKTVAFTLPIYKTKTGMTYHDWINDWCCYLAGKIADEKAKTVMIACKAAVKKDTQCARFLLPYIIVMVICNENKKDTEDVLAEIDTVLNAEEEVAAADPSCLLTQSKSRKDMERLSTQTVFSLLDHCKKWLRKKHGLISAAANRKPELKVRERDSDYGAIDAFVSAVSQKKLADASYHCQAYARSLMHLESHIASGADAFESNTFALQCVYAALQEIDYISGIAAMRTTHPPFEELVFRHQAMGNFQDALCCYESLARRQAEDAALINGMLECYSQMDQAHTALMLANGTLKRRPEWAASLHEHQMQAAWQLSQWQLIEEAGNGEPEATGEFGWNRHLAHLLLAVQRGERDVFYSRLEVAQKNLISPIVAASMEEGAYERSYSSIVKLQQLNEVELVAVGLVLGDDRELYAQNGLDELFLGWKSRTSFAQYSPRHLEPVLKVRRTLLDIALRKAPHASHLKTAIEKHLGECWLLSAKVARKSGQLNNAYNLLLEAERFGEQQSFMEKAKLWWERGDRTQAISILRKGIQDHFPWCGSEAKRGEVSIEEREECANAKLLIARYIDEAASMEAESIPGYYADAKSLATASEEVYYYIARFYDKFICKYEDTDLDGRGDFISQIMLQFGRSLVYGCSNIDQSLSRMLSLWFDYGSRTVTVNQNAAQSGSVAAKSSAKSMASSLAKMNGVMEKFFERWPRYFFLVAFPQLTSRICHPHPDVWRILKCILIRSFVLYPHHVFWHMIALSKSSFQTRVKRCQEIFDNAVAKKPELRKFIDDGRLFADKLIQLSEMKLPPGTTELERVLPAFSKLLQSKSFSSFMIPTTRNMSLMLPSSEVDRNEHNPFHTDSPRFFKVEESIMVMRSQAAPKKVTFVGSDGNKYSFLCKPRDDLRRDCRLMDFNDLLNKLFKKDAECRKRDLRIRTYKVIPLNETSGIIEWVDNLQALRGILQKLYRENGSATAFQKGDTEKYASRENDEEGNKRNYRILLERHPPVFGEWFLRNFPDPQTWFLARLGYTRTTAVMSMVGYILGLGDRHSENIMFDSSNGDTVHVDLNCLFDKGLELKIPEIVPFRLTSNMVHAMGPTGHEGPFRIACEMSLGLMRRQRDVLLSALRPFYFDPLVDWVVKGSRAVAASTDVTEVVNEKAVQTLKAIEKRLDGLVDPKRKAPGKSNNMQMPLSVAGQVNFLINEATNPSNLAQLYVGWAAYL